MPLFLGFGGLIGAILSWVLRVQGTVTGLQGVDRDTKGLQRRAVSTFEDVVGTPLQRVRDPRLTAAILMIERGRTGSPLTASEKTQIVEFMETPLEIDRISATFERAWGYTHARLPFSQVSDQVIPLLRETLTPAERAEHIALLTKVAGAHSALSESQPAGIARLRRRLTADSGHKRDTRRGPVRARTPRRSPKGSRRATCLACARCCLFSPCPASRRPPDPPGLSPARRWSTA